MSNVLQAPSSDEIDRGAIVVPRNGAAEEAGGHGRRLGRAGDEGEGCPSFWNFAT